MKFDFQRCVPPGFPVKTELRCIGLGILGSVLYSMGFLLRFFSARRELYARQLGNALLQPDRMMPDFVSLLDGTFDGFGVLLLALLFLLVYHYAYHYQGAKSIYLMRRLPKKGELHRRCLSLPLGGMGFSLLLAGALFFLYFFLYMELTPENALAPFQWQKLWR